MSVPTLRDRIAIDTGGMHNFETRPQTAQDSVPVETFTFNFEEIRIDYGKKRDRWIPILSL